MLRPTTNPECVGAKKETEENMRCGFWPLETHSAIVGWEMVWKTPTMFRAMDTFRSLSRRIVRKKENEENTRMFCKKNHPQQPQQQIYRFYTKVYLEKGNKSGKQI